MIENYVDGDASTGNADEDIITQYGYGAGRLLDTLTVTSQKADGTGVDVQTTRYVYGTDVDDYSPLVHRNDLVRAVIYSDSDDTFDTYSLYMTDGADSTYDRVEYKYNRLGELIQVTDQNGTTHAYEYDKLGRRTSDRVTTLASGVDGAIRRVDIDYTVRGQVESVTSYDNPSLGAGNVVNQVVYAYTAWGLLAREYQEHEGTVDQDTLYVEYAYAGAEHG
ncbi:MAG: RHS repeat domain-containing protein, partial [Patescibacteria group bacterium]|nr:RHS repeat domain-containing protein [Patescibacteria group bacterium]